MSLKQWGHPGFLTGFLFSDVECFSGIEVLHPGLRFFLFLFPPFFFPPPPCNRKEHQGDSHPLVQ